jgi:hypothetical protein
VLSVTILRSKPDSSGAARTHFAKTLGSRGNVLSWTVNRDEAGQFPESVMAEVARFYEGRVNGGRVVFIDAATDKTLLAVDGTTPPKPKRPPAEGPDLLAGEKLREQTSKRIGDLTAERDELFRQAVELGAQLDTVQTENHELKEKVKELEAIIASAK